jgi:hypothetical protein
MTKDAATYYRNQIAAYTDAIRISDFKANVAVIYGAFTIGPVLSFADKFPPFLPVQVVLLPFAIVFFCLLICLFPRYPREGRASLPIDRNANPEDYRVPDSHEVVLEQQQTLCVILCNILYWKTVCLRISFSIYILGTVLVGAFLFFYWISPH